MVLNTDAMAFPSHLIHYQNAVDPPPCLLLQLPCEIRLQIYTYLLTIPETTLAPLRPLTTRNHLSSYLLPNLDLTPSLLLTCRQIRDEGSPILYSQNTFCAHPTQLTATPFLLSSDRPIYYSPLKTLIRRWYITLRLDTDPRLREEVVTAAFSGVESLEVEVWQAMFGSADEKVLTLFEGVRGVKRARVHGSVRREYSRWLEGSMMAGVGERVGRVYERGDEDGTDQNMWTHGNR